MSNSNNSISGYSIIENAQIEWGNGKSTSDKPEDFKFGYFFINSEGVEPSVCVTRSTENTAHAFPVTGSSYMNFTINRNDDVGNDGDGQPFDWIAVGQKDGQNTNSNYSNVMIDGEKVALVQWGSATSRNDNTEAFNFNVDFETNCCSIITNRKEAGSKNILPVVEIDKQEFKINRNNNMDGEQEFFWMAIGDCNLNSNQCFEVDLGNGYGIKGGLLTSKSNNGKEQTFEFNSLGLNDFSNCQSVLTNRADGGAKDMIPVTDKDDDSFSINRAGEVDGEVPFYWLAIGKTTN